MTGNDDGLEIEAAKNEKRECRTGARSESRNSKAGALLRCPDRGWTGASGWFRYTSLALHIIGVF